MLRIKIIIIIIITLTITLIIVIIIIILIIIIIIIIIIMRRRITIMMIETFQGTKEHDFGAVTYNSASINIKIFPTPNRAGTYRNSLITLSLGKLSPSFCSGF